MKITFSFSDTSSIEKAQVQVSEAMIAHLKAKKDFYVEVSEFKPSKTWMQLKGIHKLFDLIAPRLSQSWGEGFTPKGAKHFLKVQFGFVQKMTEESAIAEAAKQLAKKKALGQKITRKDFNFLISEAKKEYETRSLESATKEEMIELIDKIEKLAADMGWHEVKLTSAEKKALVEFYETKNYETKNFGRTREYSHIDD